eukprot:CAMPEP_0119332718 /NCGR_PEP_ID=MMETSP1333-20130426/83429_1 /TAXON_ID=418940 /ORGANISM="Scyphosphaera apsteinii, Strain RCC1455" /LENGTH=514 /DNA_ID=CAMNT_0007342605 /DNA_START=55 /DNA_END=1599 /DNA_ORIENTATION=-
MARRTELQHPDSCSDGGTEQWVDKHAAACLLESKLTCDVMNLIFESLCPSELGVAAGVCHRWKEIVNQPSVWRKAASRLGHVWDSSSADAEARAAAAGGWKHLLRRDTDLERRWFNPEGLQAREIPHGHSHWVPAIIMEERTRQFVTCSYDGTVRFWESADVALPRCFKVLNAGGSRAEGFSTIALCAPEGEVPLLAAGSELGNIHVWEVWRQPLQVGTTCAAGRLSCWNPAAAIAPGTTANAGPTDYNDSDGNDQSESGVFDLLHFAHKLQRWNGAHDFVQSILVLHGRKVVSGGDNACIKLHELGSTSQLRRFDGHTGAVMCLASTASGRELISGSVDHSVRIWDVETGACSCYIRGHTRSVHCLKVGKAQPHGASMLFTGSRDHTIKLWDMRTSHCQNTLRGHTGSVTCVDAQGWKLVSGGGYNRGADDDEVLSVDSTIRCWDLRRLGSSQESACLWKRQAPSPTTQQGDPVLSLQLTEDKVLTSHGGTRWTARIWDFNGVQLDRPPHALP